MIPLSPAPALPGGHPLAQQDLQIVINLEAVTTPTNPDLVHAARLVIRHERSPLSTELFSRLKATVQRWGLSRNQLMERSRAIWQSGWRPTTTEDIVVQAVGSGADLEG
jgi:hypothetical protein